MNKYQKALNKINTEFWNYYGWEHCTEEINLLQELVDKETPKKTKTEMNEHNHIDRLCPICDSFVYSFNKYCGQCGQRVRSDE